MSIPAVRVLWTYDHHWSSMIASAMQSPSVGSDAIHSMDGSPITSDDHPKKKDSIPFAN